MVRGKHSKYSYNILSSHMIQSDTTDYTTYWQRYGTWDRYFGNNHPIVVELGCGKGEHSLYGAQHYQNINRIWVDIKGDRLAYGSRIADQQNLANIVFLRLDIRNLHLWFAPGQVAEILLPYPDPRPHDRDAKRRLTHPRFLQMYQTILSPGWYCKCKTDDHNLYRYTCDMATQMHALIVADHKVGILPDFDTVASQFSISKGASRCLVWQFDTHFIPNQSD